MTQNPYITFANEPPGWNPEHNGGRTWEQHKQFVEANNAVWWKKHTEDGGYAHRVDTPLNVQGDDFPLGVGNKYGPFIYCPLPVTGQTKWGFQRKEGLEAFQADVKAGTLPKGGAAKAAPVNKPLPKKAEPAPAVDLDLGVESDPFADLDIAANPADVIESMGGTVDPALRAHMDEMVDLDLSVEPESDPFAALDLSADEPAAEAPAPAPEPTFAAEMVGDDDGEPEVDEWGEVIEKPGKPASTAPSESAAEDDDPFAMLG